MLPFFRAISLDRRHTSGANEVRRIPTGRLSARYPANRQIDSMHFVDTACRARRALSGGASTGGRRHPDDFDRVWDRLAWLTLAGTAILVVLTFRDYGVTWDEDVHNWYGILALDYYLSLFADQRALHWRDLYNYGAGFDMAAAALNRFSPLGVYETRHLLNAFVGVLGLAGCWKLGRALGGPRAGSI